MSAHELPPPRAPVATTLIRLEGRDVLAVLHRISTQSLSDLAPGEVRMTLFCDFRARLLHRAAVAVTSDGAVWLARDDAPPGDLIAHVDHHVFREDVRIAPDSERYAVRAVEGGFGRTPGSLMERDGVPLELQLAADFGWAIEAGPGRAPGAIAERARILAGRPRHGHEIREEFTPFEVGLAHEVHLSKGCFTAQEALMRMVTYRGVRRRLARVRGEGAAPDAPCDTRLGDAPAGRVTSAIADGSGWMGLAVLRREALETGARLPLGASLECEVTHVFPDSSPLGLPGEAAAPGAR